MRYQPINVVQRNPCYPTTFTSHLYKHTDGKFKYVLSIHADERIAHDLPLIDITTDTQHICMLAIGMSNGRQNTRRFRGLEHNSARSVSKQNTGSAVIPAPVELEP